MTPQEFNDARKLFGVGRRGFGCILGYGGDAQNVWITVKRYETGERPIPPQIQRLVRLLVWYFEDYGFLPDVERGQRTRLVLSEEMRDG
jgi:hypothetical protein